MTLTSIAITPNTASLSVGSTVQLTAMGTYSNSSTADLTATATWTSGSPSKATVSVTGLVTSVSAGSSVITATSSSVSGTATVTCIALPNFVTDNGDLPAPKVDLIVAAPPKKLINYVNASDWNITRQSILDVKSFLRGLAPFSGLSESSSDPAPVGVANYLWLKSDGNLWLTVGGVAAQVGGYTPTGGGGVVTATAGTSTSVTTGSVAMARGVLVWGFDVASHALDPVVYQANITDNTSFVITHGTATSANKFFWRAF